MINMVELDTGRTTYKFTAKEGKFNFTGQCIFELQRIVELQARVSGEELDSSIGEMQYIDYGNITYNSYSDDGKATLSMYTNIADLSNLNSAIMTLIDELCASR